MPQLQAINEYGVDLDGMYSASRGDMEPLRIYPWARYCKICGHRLSESNPGPNCRHHIREVKKKKKGASPVRIGIVTLTNKGTVLQNHYREPDLVLGNMKYYSYKIAVAESYGYQSYVEALLGLYAKTGSGSAVARMLGACKEHVCSQLRKLGVDIGKGKLGSQRTPTEAG